MVEYSDAYIEHLKRGPFPDCVDPWAEVGQYFHQIHAEMIDHLIGQLDMPLFKKGYRVGGEMSLQIAENREPDIFVQSTLNRPHPVERINYERAAVEALADPGVKMDEDYDLAALHIKEHHTGKLVTVIEIISPTNKTKPQSIADYRSRRERLIIENGVNVVEIDLTRSVKRLIHDALVQEYPYHAAVFLVDDSPRFIGFPLSEALKRIAIPLRGEVFAVDLQEAYTHGYQRRSIATTLHEAACYSIDQLPFPSLLSDDQRDELLAAVDAWKVQLDRLTNA